MPVRAVQAPKLTAADAVSLAPTWTCPVIEGIIGGGGEQSAPPARQRRPMMVIRRLHVSRWPWKSIAAGLGAVILAAGCAHQRDATLSPVVGPCAGQPPGRGRLHG